MSSRFAIVTPPPGLHGVRAVPGSEPPALAQAAARARHVLVDVVVENSRTVKPAVWHTHVIGIKIHHGEYPIFTRENKGLDLLRPGFRQSLAGLGPSAWLRRVRQEYQNSLGLANKGAFGTPTSEPGLEHERQISRDLELLGFRRRKTVAISLGT